MSSLPNLKRWLAFSITAAVFLAIMLMAGLGGPSKSEVAAETQGGNARPCPECVTKGNPRANAVLATSGDSLAGRRHDIGRFA